MKQEQKETDLGPSPGAMLRAGRESAGFSIEQVAEKLHLLQSVVSSLEKDCYDRIRGDTFVKGYMRNYARLVGISGDEIVNRYATQQREMGLEKRETLLHRQRSRWPGSSGAGRIGLLAGLVILSAILLAYAREPIAAGVDSDRETVTIDTAKGARVVALAPAAESPAPRSGG